MRKEGRDVYRDGMRRDDGEWEWDYKRGGVVWCFDSQLLFSFDFHDSLAFFLSFYSSHFASCLSSSFFTSLLLFMIAADACICTPLCMLFPIGGRTGRS